MRTIRAFFATGIVRSTSYTYFSQCFSQHLYSTVDPRDRVIMADVFMNVLHADAAVTFVDEQVGRMVDHIDTLGLTNKTIVIFHGDQ